MVGCLDKPPMITTGKLPRKLPQEKLPLEKLPLVPTLQLDPPQPSLKPIPQLSPPNSASSHVKKISLKNRKIIDYFNNMNQKLSTSTPSPKHPPSLPPSLTTPCHKYPYTPSNTEAAWSGRNRETSEKVRVASITMSTVSADARGIAAANSVAVDDAGVQYAEDDNKPRYINTVNNDKIEHLEMNNDKNEVKEDKKSNTKIKTTKTKNKIDLKPKNKSTTMKNKNKTNNKKHAAAFDKIDVKNTRKMTDFWALKTEKCSDPDKNPSKMSGTATPDAKFKPQGILHDVKSGENSTKVKLVGQKLQPTKGIMMSGHSDWPDGTASARSSQ